jgi:hypothetical protein
VIDLTPPNAITALSITSIAGYQTPTMASINWPAPADNVPVYWQKVSKYYIRYSTSPITDEASWNAAIPVDPNIIPEPSIPTNGNLITITGLSPETIYYFAVKSADKAGNLSSLSNSPSNEPAKGTLLVESNDGSSGVTVADGSVGIDAEYYEGDGSYGELTWSIISGGGSLSATSGNSVTYNAPSGLGTTVVRVASATTPTIYKDISITIGTVAVTISADHATVLTNGQFLFNTFVKVNGDTVYENERTQLIGYQYISGSGGIQTIGMNLRKFLAPADSGNMILRVYFVAAPEIHVDVPITVVSSGPHHCTNKLSYAGPSTFSVGGNLESNYPALSKGEFSDLDPLIGETEIITLTAYVKSPQTSPIESITGVISGDNGDSETINFSLISGTLLSGVWQGSITIADTLCDNYQWKFSLTNSSGSSSDVVTIR